MTVVNWSKDWPFFYEAVELVRARLNTTVGRSENIVRQALASGDVRHDVLFNPMADDGVVGMDLDRKVYLNKEDLIDWLDRRFPQTPLQAPPAKPQGKKGQRQRAVQEIALTKWGSSGPPGDLPPAIAVKEVQDLLKKQHRTWEVSDKHVDRTLKNMRKNRSA